MALSTAKLTELPPHVLSAFTVPRRRPPRLPAVLCESFSSPFRSNGFSTAPSGSRNLSGVSSFNWIRKWPLAPAAAATPPKNVAKRSEPKRETIHEGTTAIDRIVLRLRNLGLGSDDEEEEGDLGEDSESGSLELNDTADIEFKDEKLGDLLKRDWVRPDTILVEDKDSDSADLLPWERGVTEDEEMEESWVGVKKRAVRAPTLAELTIEDEELKRLRRMGMTLRERVNVPKAGITGEVLEKIHDKWRKCELVRLKFHEELAHDMKTAHEIVERRTGGLVTWRSGSVMLVFRGTNYEGPITKLQQVKSEDDTPFVPEVSTAARGSRSPVLEKSNPVIAKPVESLTGEEAEYHNLLDGLGPRFEDWWGTGVLPVDADQLPQTIPGYKTPFRLLPSGMRSRLTNAEMTNLRKLGKSLPCHFALGRNRHHQGLAASIVKLWEKSLLVKIAVKRGIQNTNNKLMAEELKRLTGGVLLLRNKYYIVMYRGKDFLPPSVAAALTERQEMTEQIQDVEEKVRVGQSPSPVGEGKEASAGTLAEFYEAQARWGIDISAEERENMKKEASRAERARVIRRLEHKLAISQAKKLKAERLLSKIVASWIPVNPSDDQETITDEEKAVYRRIGLRMKAYLPLGIRGVFDGVIENMHLHWKHRELVKLISKEKELSLAEETARLLEYESGGILVAVERVPKGHILIYYRGKNYRRPIALRPRNLLTKAKALKRRVALQRYEALSEHISELEKSIAQTKQEIENPEKLESNNKLQNTEGHAGFSESEDEVSDEDEDEDDWNDGEDSEFSTLEESESESSDSPLHKFR
ncbi:CRM-domain containing factor CFM3A, chloroplastic/mitochondrial [Andrographis paniculata]|uniref:CRM-domain containing factor CFM3A, chloroplastic/mitochondrial n=1 Tax=Andrographis paniculata TaxID=175694 RepID=UPI0021E71048|nr:CRM-domain containing factor CFM3A, chloroplastic/mitochondrial [Andrographis paniculata]